MEAFPSTTCARLRASASATWDSIRHWWWRKRHPVRTVSTPDGSLVRMGILPPWLAPADPEPECCGTCGQELPAEEEDDGRTLYYADLFDEEKP